MLSAIEKFAVIYTWITNSLTPAPVILAIFPRKLHEIDSIPSTPHPRSANELLIRTYANHLNLSNLKKFKLINSVKIEILHCQCHWRELQAFFVLLLY